MSKLKKFGLDEKIKEYFSSDKFVEDAKRAALELSSKLECNLYYLQIYYTLYWSIFVDFLLKLCTSHKNRVQFILYHYLF